MVRKELIRALSRSTIAAWPKRAEPLHKLGMADGQVLREPPKAALIGFGRMALHTVSGLTKSRKPCRCERNEGNAAQIHDERTGLTITGCYIATERQHSEWERRTGGPWLACRIGNKRGRLGRCR